MKQSLLSLRGTKQSEATSYHHYYQESFHSLAENINELSYNFPEY